MALDDTLIRSETDSAEASPAGETHKSWESKHVRTRPQLGARDVERLMQMPSPQMRSEIAYKIAQSYNEKLFTNDETEIAQDIFRLLLRDPEVNVRRVLSKSLKANLNLPHDIALALANDVVIVAVPMLEASFVLTEQDLIAIATHTAEPGKLIAIARRESISKELSEALMSRKDEHVIYVLFRNKSASIADEPIDALFDFICRSSTLLDVLAKRGGLSRALAQKLFAVVPLESRKILRKQYHLSYRVEDDMRDSVFEWAAGGAEVKSKIPDLPSLVDHLHKKNKLNYITAIRALCRGDVRFFELVLSKLANIPLSNVRLLALDQGELGFCALYKKCNLPPTFLQPIRLIFGIVCEETDHGRIQPLDIQQRIMERILAEGYDQTVENMSYIMALMMKDGRREHTVH